MLALLLMICGAAAAASREAPRIATSPDGAKIAYYASKESGGIPTIVLSGGPGTDGRYMFVGGALERLGEQRLIVSFDQRGTAASSPADGTETIDKYVDDIDAVRRAISAPRVDLLGHSFGGYLAIAYTAKYPAQVRSLVLVDSAPPKLADLKSLLADVYPDRIEAWRAKRATLTADNASAESAIFMSMEFVTDAAFRDYLRAVADHRDNMTVNNTLRRDMDKLDYWPQVRKFEQPVLIVHGRFDAVVAPVNSWRLHEAIPNSSFRVVESAGHLPHVEQPQQFLSLLRPFLENLDREQK